MTIDEYLNGLKKAKQAREYLLNKLTIAETQAHDVRSSLNLGDGIPCGSKSGNPHESKLLKYSDAAKAYRDASMLYNSIYDNLNKAINNLLFWEGSLIQHMYIYNVVFDEDDGLNGAGEILGTKDRRVILAKLAEAKEHLADNLRAQDVPIE